MSKLITEEEAYNLYIEREAYDFCPFKDCIEKDFISMLQDCGYEIIQKDVPLHWRKIC